MTITGLVSVVFPTEEEPIFARLDRCRSLSLGTVLRSGRWRLYPPRVRTGSEAELPFTEESSVEKIASFWAWLWITCWWHLCFGHPHVNQYIGVLCHLHSSPIFPIWLVSAIYCISPVNIDSRMLHPLLPHCFKRLLQISQPFSWIWDKKSLNIFHHEFLNVCDSRNQATICTEMQFEVEIECYIPKWINGAISFAIKC